MMLRHVVVGKRESLAIVHQTCDEFDTPLSVRLPLP